MGRAKLLFVDDDRDLLQVLEARFEAKGFSVRTAFDGDAALALLRREPQDIVVVDLRMPRLDGLAVVRELRERYPELGAIVVSGNATEAQAKTALAEGADDFVGKPIDFAYLEETINAILFVRKGLPLLF